MNENYPYEQTELEKQNQLLQQQNAYLQSQLQRPTYIQPQILKQQCVIEKNNENGFGITGLVFTVLGYVLFCIAPVSLCFFALGVLFSFIGLFKKNKTCAIIGFILSILPLIFIRIFISTLMAFFNGLIN